MLLIVNGTYILEILKLLLVFGTNIRVRSTFIQNYDVSQYLA